MIIKDILDMPSYHKFKKSEEVLSHVGILTEKEAKKSSGMTINAMSDIAYFSPPLSNIIDLHKRLDSIESQLQEAPREYLDEDSMVDVGYNKVFSWLKKDEIKIAKSMKWDLPIDPEKLTAVSEIARATVDYCLVRMKEDINNFIPKTPLEAILEERKGRTESDSDEDIGKKWQNTVERKSTSSLSASSSDGSMGSK